MANPPAFFSTVVRILPGSRQKRSHSSPSGFLCQGWAPRAVAAAAAAGWGPQQSPSGILPEGLEDPAEGEGGGTRLLSPRPPHISCSIAVLSKALGHLSGSCKERRPRIRGALERCSQAKQLLWAAPGSLSAAPEDEQELAELGPQARPSGSPEKLRPLRQNGLWKQQPGPPECNCCLSPLLLQCHGLSVEGFVLPSSTTREVMAALSLYSRKGGGSCSPNIVPAGGFLHCSSRSSFLLLGKTPFPVLTLDWVPRDYQELSVPPYKEPHLGAG